MITCLQLRIGLSPSYTQQLPSSIFLNSQNSVESKVFPLLHPLRKIANTRAEQSRAKMASSTQLKSDALLEQMKLHLSTDAGKEITKKIGLVYQFNIAPKKIGFNEEIYVVDLKKGEVKKGPYEGGKPDATFSFTDEDFFKVATGKMNPQIAFMRGAMKVKGSLSAAQKFTPDIFPKPSKM